MQGESAKTVYVPGSKNLSLRALFLASLAEGTSVLHNLAVSEDMEVAKTALRSLGAQIEGERVTGVDGKPRSLQGPLDIKGSGVSMRFLTAVCALVPGKKIVQGNTRMHERPIKELVHGLEQLGVEASCSETGCPPVELKSMGITGGETEMQGGESSQYFSAITMVAPYAKSDVTIRIKGKLVSEDFLKETIGVMREFGAEVAYEKGAIHVTHGKTYKGREYTIPGDWVAASYWMAYAALNQKTLAIKGLDLEKEQAEKEILHVFEQMGCEVKKEADSIIIIGRPLHGITVTEGRLIDTAPTVMMLGLFAEGKTVLRNIRHLRLKESDRIGEMARILRSLGAEVTEFDDGIEITGTKNPATHEVDPANDHRIAMSFGVAATRLPGLKVLNPGCVEKSYPSFWDELKRVEQV